MRDRVTLVAAVGAALAALVAAGPAAADVRLDRVVGSFVQPVAVTAPAGDRRLFVVERPGRIRIVDGGVVRRTPFLDIRSRVTYNANVQADHGGLLSLAFAPDYRTSGRFYVFSSAPGAWLRVDEYRRSARSPDRALPGSRRTVFEVRRRATTDLGGQIAFGPDRRLYVGLGTQDEPSLGQDRDSPYGKLIALRPERPGARPAIVALGLRTPWRFSFDRRTGAFSVADVGLSRWEEIDHVPFAELPGANFGWPVVEGPAGRAQPGFVGPVLWYPHPRFCAIIGGHVVRGPGAGALEGRYLYGDLCSGVIRSALFDGRRPAPNRREGELHFLVSFGVDGLGRSYAVSLNGGVYRLTAR
jgi:glucose/arabinose dehydrogenase